MNSLRLRNQRLAPRVSGEPRHKSFDTADRAHRPRVWSRTGIDIERDGGGVPVGDSTGVTPELWSSSSSLSASAFDAQAGPQLLDDGTSSLVSQGSSSQLSLMSASGGRFSFSEHGEARDDAFQDRHTKLLSLAREKTSKWLEDELEEEPRYMSKAEIMALLPESPHKRQLLATHRMVNSVGSPSVTGAAGRRRNSVAVRARAAQPSYHLSELQIAVMPITGFLERLSGTAPTMRIAAVLAETRRADAPPPPVQPATMSRTRSTQVVSQSHLGRLVSMLQSTEAGTLPNAIKTFVSTIKKIDMRAALAHECVPEDEEYMPPPRNRRRRATDSRGPASDSSTDMLPAEKVRSFLQQLDATMQQHPLWKSVAAVPEQWSSVTDALESLVMCKLHSHVFGARHDDAAKDRELRVRIASLSFIQFTHLDMPPPPARFAPAWLLAQKALQAMDRYKSPAHKLACIMNCCRVVSTMLTLMTEEGAGVGADEFLPALIYTLIRANPPRLHSNLRLIGEYRDPNKLMSEQGYFFTNVLSAVAFVKTLNAGYLSNITQEEFDAALAAARPAMDELSRKLENGADFVQTPRVEWETVSDSPSPRLGPSSPPPMVHTGSVTDINELLRSLESSPDGLPGVGTEVSTSQASLRDTYNALGALIGEAPVPAIPVVHTLAVPVQNIEYTLAQLDAVLASVTNTVPAAAADVLPAAAVARGTAVEFTTPVSEYPNLLQEYKSLVHEMKALLSSAGTP